MFSLFASNQNIFAQDPNWNSFLTIAPFPSPYYTQWERDPSIGSLTLIYNGTAATEFQFDVIITNPNYGDVLTGVTEYFSFDYGPMTRVFTIQDVIDFGSAKVNSEIDRLIKQTGMFPE